MCFVDGENLTHQGQRLVSKQHAHDESLALKEGRYWKKSFFLWVPDLMGYQVWPGAAGPQTVEDRAIRATYYTGFWGNTAKDELEERLLWLGFDPVVLKKPTKPSADPSKENEPARSKGVDIALTKDMLSHAFYGNYDIAVLIAGYGDFVPLVQEVKRLGKRVHVGFFQEEGLSPELRRTADHFFDLTRIFVERWRQLST